MITSRLLFPISLLLAGFVLAAALTLYNMQALLPMHIWPQAWAKPDPDSINQMLFHYSLLPRLVIALLVGAGLGLVGVLFQQVLRNPLAEPTTLGVASGAQLGITVATLWALPPSIQPFAALLGAAFIGLIVFGVSWGGDYHRSR